MGYTINSLDDKLTNHAFQINGAIALRNYTAQVDGSRVKITSTENAALSILECEVSEVEINGQVYTNPEEAQNALNSIVYADLPIVVLTEEEKKHLIFKDGKNIDAESRQILREKLGIGDIPSNVATIDEGGNEGSVYTKQQVDAKIPEDTNLSNTDLTIAENEVRALNVLGRLDITGLEEKDADDVSFGHKVVMNEDGTLAKKVDNPPLNVTFPSTINVNHKYLDVSRKNESWQEDILEQVKNLQNNIYKNYDISNKVHLFNYDNVEPLASRVVDNKRVIVQYRNGFRNIDTAQELATAEIELPTSDFIMKMNNVKKAGLYNAAFMIIKANDLAIGSIRGESYVWSMGNNNGSRNVHSNGLTLDCYLIKQNNLISLVMVSRTNTSAGLEVYDVGDSSLEKLTIMLSIGSNIDYLELSDFKIKYL